jgi:hypothetical protein
MEDEASSAVKITFQMWEAGQHSGTIFDSDLAAAVIERSLFFKLGSKG